MEYIVCCYDSEYYLFTKDTSFSKYKLLARNKNKDLFTIECKKHIVNDFIDIQILRNNYAKNFLDGNL